jgi:hypothetical protein
VTPSDLAMMYNVSGRGFGLDFAGTWEQIFASTPLHESSMNAADHAHTMADNAQSAIVIEQKETAEGVDERYFFLLHHKPEEIRFLDQKVRFSNPSGFSGAIVWDTGYVNCLNNGESWTPDMAQVAGMVCRWVTGDPGIKVLRIEHLRSYLLYAIEDLRANGDW